MAFKAKKLRLSSKSTVAVKLGYKRVVITITMPIKQFTQQAVKAAFGKHAQINGRH